MSETVFAARAVAKRFGATAALDCVDLSLRAGEAVALMGANGAGKSTLVKIVSGVFAPDAGTLTLRGARYAPASPYAAKRAGVATVHQSVADAVAPSLSIADNLLLDTLCDSKSRWLATPASRVAVALPLARRVGLQVDRMDLRAPLGTFSLAAQQLVVIARALAAQPALLILDEPTASLGAADAERLLTLVDALRADGVAILLVSHRTGDLRRIADRIVVLRDGRIVSTQVTPFDFDSAHEAMIGRRVPGGSRAAKAAVTPGADHVHVVEAECAESAAPELTSVSTAIDARSTGSIAASDKAPPAYADPADAVFFADVESVDAVTVTALSAAYPDSVPLRTHHTGSVSFPAAMTGGTCSNPAVQCFSARGIRLLEDSEPFDLDVRRGEIVAITGPVGGGKSRFARAVFGAERLAAGSMRLDGMPWRPRSPAHAIRANVFLVAEDRWRTSLFPDSVPFATLAGTLSLPFLSRWFPFGFVSAARERQAALDAIARFGIRCMGPDDRLTHLSGGNQQKAAIARWHLAPARLLLLDEPFQGIDVGARAELIALLRNEAAARATLVFVSDLDDAYAIADRVLPFDRGTLDIQFRFAEPEASSV
ncbi:sugar ABC transporter ATP-binding protein [Burkholderia singularis]|uniref:Ribose ABC transport system, ATP-binding protein RbsA (TC 3.A.1.2.1) n=1 Tax=Burkholderia singularis TaxID=1503053 RepID=A0A238H0P9_9BURK|nr:sugar ABC transporter ATP-binding protein [Burkholderia singularis]SMF98800.1 Ribose ABC transport system, ATP-binding protein RbsA (TC 3.A.1.2.1) [Burkholderia singularis]